MALDKFSDYLALTEKGVNRDNAMVERRLAKMYRDTYKQVNQEIADLYARLGDKMTLPEAQKYKRLEAIQASLKAQYAKLTGKALNIAIDTSAQNYTEAFERYAWAMDQAVGINLAWSVIPVDAIRASVFSEYSGLNIVKTFKKNMLIELAKLQAALTRGIASGRGYAKTAAELKNLFNNGYNDAIRVVRTEAGRNYTEGELLAYDNARDMGINVRNMWNATRDGRTRNDHGRLDGTFPDENGDFKTPTGGKGPGPGLMQNAADDINCRCRLTGEIDGLPPEMMRVRGEGEIPYQTFSQWAEPKGWTADKGWPKTKLV